MKIFILLTFVFFIFSLNIYSQDISIEDLKAPSSPAFTILGINPTSLEKPATPKTLGVSLINNFKNANVLPKSFALEVSPYWLGSHPYLSFTDYYSKSDPWMNTSFSIATTPLDTPSTGTAMSFGARTLLFNGSPSEEFIKKFNVYEKRNEFRDQTLRDLYRLIRKYLNNNVNHKMLNEKIDSLIINFNNNSSVLKYFPADKQKVKRDSVFNDYKINLINWLNEDIHQNNDTNYLSSAEKESINNNLDTKTAQYYNTEDTTLVNEIRALDKKRFGFILGLSAAVSGQFRNDSVKNGKFYKVGAWLNPTYSCENFDFVSTIRYISVIDDNSMYDTGLRLIWTHKDFDISVEALLRAKNNAGPTYRYTLNMEYKLFEGTYLTGVFGKDFAGNSVTPKGDLITLLGINFGLGKQQSIKL
jgi:hypothetical protein